MSLIGPYTSRVARCGCCMPGFLGRDYLGIVHLYHRDSAMFSFMLTPDRRAGGDCAGTDDFSLALSAVRRVWMSGEMMVGPLSNQTDAIPEPTGAFCSASPINWFDVFCSHSFLIGSAAYCHSGHSFGFRMKSFAALSGRAMTMRLIWFFLFPIA